MTTKHTPGPWRTCFTGTGWTINYDGPDHHWLIATVNETPYIGHHGANARLLAEAPAMAEALRILERCALTAAEALRDRGLNEPARDCYNAARDARAILARIDNPKEG